MEFWSAIFWLRCPSTTWIFQVGPERLNALLTKPKILKKQRHSSERTNSWALQKIRRVFEILLDLEIEKPATRHSRNGRRTVGHCSDKGTAEHCSMTSRPCRLRFAASGRFFRKGQGREPFASAPNVNKALIDRGDSPGSDRYLKRPCDRLYIFPVVRLRPVPGES